MSNPPHWRKRENAYLQPQKSQPTGIDNAGRGDQSECQVCCDRLMQRGAGGMPQAFNLVLDHQFPALEFDNLQIIC
jgi:hypothetical protein